jgi:hypothetical protein
MPEVFETGDIFAVDCPESETRHYSELTVIGCDRPIRALGTKAV